MKKVENDELEVFDDEEIPEYVFDDEIPEMVDLREMSTYEMTGANGEQTEINVIHEITLGDIIISTALFAILIFMIISTVVRGKRS